MVGSCVLVRSPDALEIPNCSFHPSMHHQPRLHFPAVAASTVAGGSAGRHWLNTCILTISVSVPVSRFDSRVGAVVTCERARVGSRYTADVLCQRERGLVDSNTGWFYRAQVQKASRCSTIRIISTLRGYAQENVQQTAPKMCVHIQHSGN